ncbi:MAG: GGDEF domain-containing protein [Gemmobacter sp.]
MDGLASMMNGIALMALIASVFGVLLRAPVTAGMRDLALGALFGWCAGLPGLVPAGAGIVDPQVMLLGFAAAFLSLAGLAVAGAMGLAVMAAVSGGLPGDAQAAALLAAACCGLLWSLVLPQSVQARPVGHAALGVMVAAGATLPAAGSGAGLASAAMATGPAVLMALAMGAMVGRERAQAAREAALAAEARTDALTCLCNRRGLTAKFDMAAADWPRRGLAVAVFDLDRFKAVNDIHGHDAGDAVLQRAAAILDAARGGQGVLARLGGEEFALLLPGIGRAEALDAAERMRAALAQSVVPVASGAALRPTVSGGVAWSGAPRTLGAMLKAADLALYAAKASGRNCVRAAGTVPETGELPRPVDTAARRAVAAR